MTRIILKRGEEGRLLAGHPWVFDNEIDAVYEENQKTKGISALQSGFIADVETSNKKYVGRSFVNPASKITARLYSHSKEGVDEGFFRRRIRASINERWNYDLKTECARLVFAEADFLPGLIIDQYVGWDYEKVKKIEIEQLGAPSKWLCIQFLTYAMDMRKTQIIKALEYVLNNPEASVIAGIIEKSASPVREKEGLPLFEGIISGSVPQNGIVVLENGAPHLVDLIGGQKTGAFLDQKENHARCASYAKKLQMSLGRKIKVLDAFCYSGGFGLSILKQACACVYASDSSHSAIETLKRNAELNGASDFLNIYEENVFDLLTKFEKEKEQFDLIILDPPAFAKSRSALDAAKRGYKEINLKALKLLTLGGILVTCSCSYALSDVQFKSIIAEAAFDAGKRLVQLDFCCQSSDHPILVGYDESCYLKCAYYRVLKK